jgi:hypothetical protein
VIGAESVVHEGLERALATGAQWLWLLDGSAIPRSDALMRLLGALGDLGPLPSPALLTAKVVGSRGELVAAQTGWYRRTGTQVALNAAPRHLLPIRTAPAGCLLVRREAAAVARPPLRELEGPGAALEWTARLLRHDMGYLVPASVARAAGDVPWPPDAVGGDPLEDLRASAAMLFGSGWSPRERLWVGGGAARRARAAVGAGRVAPAALLRAAATGARAGLTTCRGGPDHAGARAATSGRFVG